MAGGPSLFRFAFVVVSVFRHVMMKFIKAGLIDLEDVTS